MKICKFVVLIILFSISSLVAKRNDFVVGLGTQSAFLTQSISDYYKTGFGGNLSVGKFIGDHVLLNCKYAMNYYSGKTLDKDILHYIDVEESWATEHDLSIGFKYYFMDLSASLVPIFSADYGTSFFTHFAKSKSTDEKEFQAHNHLYINYFLTMGAGVAYPLTDYLNTSLMFHYSLRGISVPVNDDYIYNLNLGYNNFDIQLTFSFILSSKFLRNIL